jgi:hypothetical protein
MRIELDVSINADVEALLREALGDPEDLVRCLQGHFQAACQEYLAMYCGERVFRRGSDLLDFRLFLLVQHAFHHRLPDEQTVSRLFQMTASESRALLRSLLAKYQIQLKASLRYTIRELLQQAQSHPSGPEYGHYLRISNQAVVNELNQQLAVTVGTVSPVQKLRGSVNTYHVDPAAMAILRVNADLQALA